MRSARPIVTILTLLLASGAAMSAPPPDSGGAAVTLRSVDRATVRIFGVRGVTALEVVGKKSKKKRTVAQPKASHGSGVAITADGLIVTAKHVVEGADLLAILVPGETVARPARVIYSHPKYDIAFLATTKGLPAHLMLPAQSPKLQALERVSSSGYPLDPRERMPAATSGEVSRNTNDGRLQVAMSLNPGNSGGPIINAAGVLLGVVSLGADPSKGAQGIVIAEPVVRIRAAYDAHVAPTPRPQWTDAAGKRELAVAGLVADSFRLGAMGLMTGAKTTRPTIEGLAKGSPEAEVLVLLAAYSWNVIQILLEEHLVTVIADLPPESAKLATDLRATVVTLCKRARRADPMIGERYPFVRTVLDRPGPKNTVKKGSGRSRPAARGPTRYRASWFHISLHPALALNDHPTAPLVGGGVFAVNFTQTMLRFGDRQPVEFGWLLSMGASIGSWRDALSGHLSLETGVGLRFGREIGASASILWTPALVGAEGRSVAITLKGYRVMAGVQVNSMSFGLGYQELGRGADATYRLLSVYAEFGL